MATAAPTTQAGPTRADIQARARDDIENRRRDAEQQARQGLDRDAVEAIEETRRALRAILDGKPDEAVAAIERATGKIDVLTARNPAAALLPVDADALVIDTAPAELDAVRMRADLAVDMALFRDFPTVRVLLAGLISEIRIRTYRLPLATYPNALREAARLLDEKKYDHAATWLRVALGTLVVVDRIIPLPLILAQAAIGAAEELRDRDRNAAQRLLAVARDELERAMELGYMGRDDEYKTLSRTISDLEKQLKGDENSTSAFAKLKQRLAEFVDRLSGSSKDSHGRQAAEQRQAAQSQQAAPQGRQAPPGRQQGYPPGQQGPTERQQTSPDQPTTPTADQPRGAGASPG